MNRAGHKIVAVHKAGQLLVIRGDYSAAMSNARLICNIADQSSHTASHEDTLYQFHIRMGHLHYDAIEALANKPGSGMVLTDTKRPTCLTCHEGKQSRNAESRQDSGTNAPIDRVVGGI